ncbi:hypothetical protein BJX61DRAFT_414139 [Aspergillus egyptiacus]|nr:hypothetical protein BJX61DRAFT_414139 [Aspergillus egyptiacus]
MQLSSCHASNPRPRLSLLVTPQKVQNVQASSTQLIYCSVWQRESRVVGRHDSHSHQFRVMAQNRMHQSLCVPHQEDTGIPFQIPRAGLLMQRSFFARHRRSWSGRKALLPSVAWGGRLFDCQSASPTGKSLRFGDRGPAAGLGGVVNNRWPTYTLT